MTATSEKDGSFLLTKYVWKMDWREIEQPEGFVLDETSYEVKSPIRSGIEVEIVNK
jgi:hypothetical protein